MIAHLFNANIYPLGDVKQIPNQFLDEVNLKLVVCNSFALLYDKRIIEELGVV